MGDPRGLGAPLQRTERLVIWVRLVIAAITIIALVTFLSYTVVRRDPPLWVLITVGVGCILCVTLPVP